MSRTSLKTTKRTDEPRWTFTQPRKRLDMQGHAPSSASYDPKTILIPSSVYSTMSLSEKQYWDLKKHHMDKVLFYQLGLVYELFEDDALIASREFGLEVKSSRNGGPNMFYCTIPAKQLTEWKRKFAERGYKIAIAMEMNEKEDNIHGTILKRQVVEMISPGVRSEELLESERANYLLALREDANSHKVGVCFVDVSTGKMFLEVLHDDEKRTQVDMLLQQIVPSEILLPKQQYSKNIRKIIHALGKKDVVTELKVGKEFLSVDDTEKRLLEGSYFPQCTNYESWPAVLRYFMIGEHREPVVISALGAILYALQEVDKDSLVFSRGRIERYNIRDSVQFMHLDGHTLTNLEILTNNDDFTQRGSLLEHMCLCYTPSGKRLFSHWLSHPLRNVERIEERLDAIDDFNTLQVDEELFEELKSFGDIERQVQLIHSYIVEYKKGLNLRHANSMSHIKKRAATFYRTLESMRKMCRFVQRLQNLVQDLMNDDCTPLKSTLLHKTLSSPFRLVTLDENQVTKWSDLDSILGEFQDNFSKENIESKDDLVFVPKRFTDFDNALAEVKMLQSKLTKFIEKLQSNWGDEKIRHRERDIVEVPASLIETVTIPSDWVEKSKLRRMVQYSVAEVGDLDARLTEANEELNSLLTRLVVNLMEIFDEQDSTWRDCIDRLATLDCLFSLWRLSNYSGYTRPSFVDTAYEDPRIHIIQGRHPVVETSIDNYVANDTFIGAHHPHALLISGPNQGGKSCLLRQTAVIVIMAQVGSYVPAEQCTISALDRVFTRIGANDRILKGESTFMVEMTETSNILQHATSKSLVILDELGRGTSTFDGYSLAYAVLRYLIEKTHSMTLFATHYHNLCREMEGDTRVRLLRMRFHDQSDTPLFQLEPGISPSSYGLRVARMAGLPDTIVKRAKEVSHVFKKTIDIPDGAQKSKRSLTEKEEELFLKLALHTKNMSDDDLLELQREARSQLYDMYS